MCITQEDCGSLHSRSHSFIGAYMHACCGVDLPLSHFRPSTRDAPCYPKGSRSRFAASLGASPVWNESFASSPGWHSKKHLVLWSLAWTSDFSLPDWLHQVRLASLPDLSAHLQIDLHGPPNNSHQTPRTVVLRSWQAPSCRNQFHVWLLLITYLPCTESWS